MCGECKHEKMISRENLKILNLRCPWRVTVCRVNPETCVTSGSMKKKISRENLKILNQTCAQRV